jgi:hypothetical protein
MSEKRFPEYYSHLRGLLGKLGKELPGPMGGFASWCRLPSEHGVNRAGVGQEGTRRIAVSPTGSTQGLLPLRVTKDRVGTSRAKLHDGHGAPVPCRPRTRAGRPRISQHLAAANTLPGGVPFTGRRGPRGAGGCMDSFGPGGAA